uniref:Uncharacterized protein n=1 Tax=Physcomitrium patens TaxID=3218 RepID=A0A2K1KKS7_PHYPA|nr:hypothetical protein PHYPA_008059 [Physcomitrium patens]
MVGVASQDLFQDGNRQDKVNERITVPNYGGSVSIALLLSMLSGEPGRLSMRIVVVPFLNPLRKYFEHLSMIDSQKLRLSSDLERAMPLAKYKSLNKTLVDFVLGSTTLIRP